MNSNILKWQRAQKCCESGTTSGGHRVVTVRSPFAHHAHTVFLARNHASVCARCKTMSNPSVPFFRSVSQKSVD